MKSHRSLLLCTLTVALCGCSTWSRHHDPEPGSKDEAQAKADSEAFPDSPACTQKLVAKEETIKELKAEVDQLSIRALDLEAKLQYSSTPKPRQDSVVGVDLKPSVAPHDPQGGFHQDAAVLALRQGMILFDGEKYPEAILAYSAMIERNPRHPLAGVAQYFLAESYFQENDFATAETEFLRVLSNYENSPYVSQSLAHLSICAAKLGKVADAKLYAERTSTIFPGSPAMGLLKDHSDKPAPRLEAAPAARVAPPSSAATVHFSGESAPHGAAIDAPHPPSPPTGGSLDEMPLTAPDNSE